MKIDFFNSIDELQQYAPGVESSLQLQTLLPSYLTARQAIISVVTQKVWNELVAETENEDLLAVVRIAVANRIMYEHQIFLATEKNNTDQKMYKYQYEEIKDKYITLYWSAMDSLLSYLDGNSGYGEWGKSEGYLQRQSLLVKSAAEFNFYFGIDSSPYFFSKVQFLIRKTTDDHIKPRVGKLEDVKPDSDFGKKVLRALCYHVMAQAVQLFDLTELPKSIRNDITHEFSKSGSMMQVREKLTATLMADVRHTPPCAPEATDALNKFTGRFAPAASPIEATHAYGTEELLRAISALLPGFALPTSEAVIRHLQENGYKFDLMPGQFSLEYKWLLVER